MKKDLGEKECPFESSMKVNSLDNTKEFRNEFIEDNIKSANEAVEKYRKDDRIQNDLNYMKIDKDKDNNNNNKGNAYQRARTNNNETHDTSQTKPKGFVTISELLAKYNKTQDDEDVGASVYLDNGWDDGRGSITPPKRLKHNPV